MNLILDKGTFAVVATAHQNSDMFRSTLLLFALVCLIGFLLSAGQANAQVSPSELPAMAVERLLLVGLLLWDAHEVSVGSLRRYARATGFLSQAEREAGGFIYEAGWTKKPGWTWQSPYGVPAADNEPAVHLTFSEAQAVCQFFNKRLPTDKEWVDAAYLEQRAAPPQGFVRGKRYAYPSGDSPAGAHCLRGCGSYTGLAPRGSLWQGDGHVAVMTTQRGVNGLWDMGGNVWEWVDSGKGSEAITRGASWWYGPERQKESDVATKPMDTRVADIGFRCVQKPS
ncbi:MAG: hypothetical protein RLZZ133_628 [Pseudomonadota bacterium]